jgi:large subunit ribosomal protein L19
MNKIDSFNKKQLKKDIHEIKPGYTVRVHQRVKEGDKERIQIFEGLVIACKHGRGVNGTITVRKVSQGFGVERIFPLHSPVIEKIEVVKKHKVRRAKLYYIRHKTAKQARLKEKTEKKK